MNIQQNISLKPYNTFAINAKADSFASFASVDELKDILEKSDPSKSLLVLGGGSNLLLTQDFPGLVIRNEIVDIQLIKEDNSHYYVKAAAGENWHQFVLYCLDHHYYGLENLSLIPGCVGASPIQNIGAYGVEIKDVFDHLEAFDLEDRIVRTFSNNDCEFGYRDSIFKRVNRNRFVILNVTYRLDKVPRLQTTYGVIGQELASMGITEITPRDVSNAVIRIRSSKLPDPAVTGNAGSFFKNPVISRALYDHVKTSYPTIPGYQQDDGVKVPAGWLIEQCGWKGYRKGDAGCYDKQALVLVNYGNATGKEIYDLSEEIIQSVQSKFGIGLEREVNIL